jgi:hypothetical protein
MYKSFHWCSKAEVHVTDMNSGNIKEFKAPQMSQPHVAWLVSCNKAIGSLGILGR